MEWKLADQKLIAVLACPDFLQSHSSWPETVRFLHAVGGWGRLASGLDAQLLMRCLASGEFSCSPNSAKKSKKSERCHRRSNQKKKSQAPDASAVAAAANGDDSDATNDDCGDAKMNTDSQQVVKQAVITDVLSLFPLLNCLLHLQNVPERMWHELAHLTEELDQAEAESAKISNEIELLSSTYMEDSHEQECDLE